MKFCPERGVKLENPDATICPKCHTAIGTGKPSKGPKQKKPKYLKKEDKKRSSEKKAKKKDKTVSYTHLTLPTIYSV